MSIADAVTNASRSAIHDAAIGLKLNRLPYSEWLRTNNRYGTDTIERIKADKNRGVFYHSHMAEYLAVSVISHCFDGWNYLSRSAAALINGDRGTAIHMAYYAELRAVISFLASEGIGIFNHQHCWIDNRGRCHFFNDRGTHEVARLILKEWLSSNRSNQLLELLRINGKTFTEWLNAARVIPSTASLLATDWLEAWSVDFDQLRLDKDVRNIVSYRPQNIFSSPIPESGSKV